VADPRLPELGQRAVLPGATPSSEGAQVIYGRQYRSWRIEHGVAEGNEMPAGVSWRVLDHWSTPRMATAKTRAGFGEPINGSSS